MATQAHPHQHSVKVIGSGTTLEQALSHALAGLTDPAGHYSRMAFQSFELLRVGGTFAADGNRTVQVTIEAYASHKD